MEKATRQVVVHMGHIPHLVDMAVERLAATAERDMVEEPRPHQERKHLGTHLDEVSQLAKWMYMQETHWHVVPVVEGSTEGTLELMPFLKEVQVVAVTLEGFPLLRIMEPSILQA